MAQAAAALHCHLALRICEAFGLKQHGGLTRRVSFASKANPNSTRLNAARYRTSQVAAWHLGVVDEPGRVVATSSFYPVACPLRPELKPAVQLQFMAVDPAVRRQGLGSAVMAEADSTTEGDRHRPLMGQRSRYRRAVL